MKLIPTRLVILIALLGVVMIACGDSDPGEVGDGASGDATATRGPFPEGAVGVRASTDIGVGRDRLLIGVGGVDGSRLGSPDQAVSFRVAPLDDSDDSQTVPATFTWILEPVVGLYRAEVDFDRSGPWQAVVIPETGDPLEPVLFNVADDPFAPTVGEPAPAPETPTAATTPIEELTTDPEPDMSFYEMSIDDAISSGSPTVLVFSTPAYCQTAACGPLLETVKDAAPDHAGVNFIHVEIFAGLTDEDFVPDAAHLAPAVGPDYYNLPSEPWVFVVDPDGIIAARYEGVMDRAELDAILEKISL